VQGRQTIVILDVDVRVPRQDVVQSHLRVLVACPMKRSSALEIALVDIHVLLFDE
jgi:hypothetical protein